MVFVNWRVRGARVAVKLYGGVAARNWVRGPRRARASSAGGESRQCASEEIPQEILELYCGAHCRTGSLTQSVEIGITRGLKDYRYSGLRSASREGSEFAVSKFSVRAT